MFFVNHINLFLTPAPSFLPFHFLLIFSSFSLHFLFFWRWKDANLMQDTSNRAFWGWKDANLMQDTSNPAFWGRKIPIWCRTHETVLKRCFEPSMCPASDWNLSTPRKSWSDWHLSIPKSSIWCVLHLYFPTSIYFHQIQNAANIPKNSALNVIIRSNFYGHLQCIPSALADVPKPWNIAINRKWTWYKAIMLR